MSGMGELHLDVYAEVMVSFFQLFLLLGVLSRLKAVPTKVFLSGSR